MHIYLTPPCLVHATMVHDHPSSRCKETTSRVALGLAPTCQDLRAELNSDGHAAAQHGGATTGLMG